MSLGIISQNLQLHFTYSNIIHFSLFSNSYVCYLKCLHHNICIIAHAAERDEHFIRPEAGISYGKANYMHVHFLYDAIYFEDHLKHFISCKFIY